LVGLSTGVGVGVTVGFGVGVTVGVGVAVGVGVGVAVGVGVGVAVGVGVGVAVGVGVGVAVGVGVGVGVAFGSFTVQLSGSVKWMAPMNVPVFVVPRLFWQVIVKSYSPAVRVSPLRVARLAMLLLTGIVKSAVFETPAGVEPTAENPVAHAPGPVTTTTTLFAGNGQPGVAPVDTVVKLNGSTEAPLAGVMVSVPSVPGAGAAFAARDVTTAPPIEAASTAAVANATRRLCQLMCRITSLLDSVDRDSLPRGWNLLVNRAQR